MPCCLLDVSGWCVECKLHERGMGKLTGGVHLKPTQSRPNHLLETHSGDFANLVQFLDAPKGYLSFDFE